MSENEAVPVIQILNLYCQNLYDKNLESFLNLYADDAKIFDVFGSEWLHHTSDSWRASTTDWFKSMKQDRMMVEFEEIQVEQSFQTGFLSALALYNTVSPKGKMLQTVEVRFTCIVEPRDGAWKITHQHASLKK